MTGGWEQIAADFHERVRANCWDTLAGRLLMLHEPHVVGGEPVCHGCDRERAERGGSDPLWPCRTYTILASTMLNVRDIEATLDRLHTAAAAAGSVAPARPAQQTGPLSPAVHPNQENVAPQGESVARRAPRPITDPAATEGRPRKETSDVSQASTLTVALWSAPTWAQTSDRDDEALIHSRSIGVLHDLDGDTLSVDVVQRDEMIFAPNDASVERTPPFVRVAGQRMDGRQAGLLSQLLAAASDLAAGTSALTSGGTHPKEWPSRWPLVLVSRPSESDRAMP